MASLPIFMTSISSFILAVAMSLGTASGQEARTQRDVRAMITPKGEIEFYEAPRVEPHEAASVKKNFEGAVKNNMGLATYLRKHPGTTVLVGQGKQFFALGSEQLEKKDFNANEIELGSGAAQSPAGISQMFQIDPEDFLKNLGNSLAQRAKTMACSVQQKPKSIEASASVEVFTVTATWDTNDLCK